MSLTRRNVTKICSRLAVSLELMGDKRELSTILLVSYDSSFNPCGLLGWRIADMISSGNPLCSLIVVSQCSCGVAAVVRRSGTENGSSGHGAVRKTRVKTVENDAEPKESVETTGGC